MKLQNWMKLGCVTLAVAALAACSTGQKRMDGAAVDQANAAYGEGAQAAGTGEESGFGEEGSREARLSKRVYYFDYDSNIVREENKPAIDANAQYLVAHAQAKIILEGHTDPRGSREYNIGLGERRAKAVADILTAKGVNPAQIRLVSYGAEKLAMPGHDEAAYAQDRRVVLAYLQK